MFQNWRSVGFPIATLNVAKVFKQARVLNEKIEQMKVEIEQFDKEIRERTKAIGGGKIEEQLSTAPASASQAQEQAGKKVIEAAVIVKRQEFLAKEAVVYADAYADMEKAVMKISKSRDVGIVIRTQNDEIKARDRSTVLQGVNRPVIYSAVPDLTDEVLAELNR